MRACDGRALQTPRALNAKCHCFLFLFCPIHNKLNCIDKISVTCARTGCEDSVRIFAANLRLLKANFLLDISLFAGNIRQLTSLNKIGYYRMGKRKCKFTDELKTKYVCFINGRNENEAKCTVCDSFISVAHKGKKLKAQYLNLIIINTSVLFY